MELRTHKDEVELKLDESTVVTKNKFGLILEKFLDAEDYFRGPLLIVTDLIGDDAEIKSGSIHIVSTKMVATGKTIRYDIKYDTALVIDMYTSDYFDTAVAALYGQYGDMDITIIKL